MAIIFEPKTCDWSPHPLTGPNTERIDEALDTEEPDGGRGRGAFRRVRRSADAGQSQSEERWRVRGEMLPPQTTQAAAVAHWRGGGVGDGGGLSGRPGVRRPRGDT